MLGSRSRGRSQAVGGSLLRTGVLNDGSVGNEGLFWRRWKTFRSGILDSFHNFFREKMNLSYCPKYLPSGGQNSWNGYQLTNSSNKILYQPNTVPRPAFIPHHYSRHLSFLLLPSNIRLIVVIHLQSPLSRFAHKRKAIKVTRIRPTEPILSKSVPHPSKNPTIHNK